MVVAKDGVIGLFGRGLKTKIIANGMQVRTAAGNRADDLPMRLAALMRRPAPRLWRAPGPVRAPLQGSAATACRPAVPCAHPVPPPSARPTTQQGLMFSVLWRLGQDYMSAAK